MIASTIMAFALLELSVKHVEFCLCWKAFDKPLPAAARLELFALDNETFAAAELKPAAND